MLSSSRTTMSLLVASGLKLSTCAFTPNDLHQHHEHTTLRVYLRGDRCRWPPMAGVAVFPFGGAPARLGPPAGNPQFCSCLAFLRRGAANQ